jgi:NAD(P)-dependent dehydrogenase (short-subunit alcohol dehydrogenase family)
MLQGTKSNIVGTIFLFNAFLPLILKGSAKKVAFISSGHGDIELIRNFDVDDNAPYAVGKAATNAVVAKYSAEYRKEGVLFMSISPGVVDTGNYANCELLSDSPERVL